MTAPTRSTAARPIVYCCPMVRFRSWFAFAALLVEPTGCTKTCVDDGLHANQSACQITPGGTSTGTTSSLDATDETGVTTSLASTDVSTSSESTSTSTSTGAETTSESSDTGVDPCADEMLSPGESDVDCGGTCPPCGPTKLCSGDPDCASKLCHPQGFCSQPECFNGVYDAGIEWYIDCGGDCGPTCPLGFPCEDSSDCALGMCLGLPGSMKCALDPTCANNQVDDDVEDDVDCGSLCGPSCKHLQNCDDPTDCLNNDCSGNLCFFLHCENGALDPGELAMDCGGECGPCGFDAPCVFASDCFSQVCTDGYCA